ncbi:hypothetical protein MTsPCn9_19370 [Croceitalea sp. MTPC9]|uniref:hypothetical protein n=1 Tax=unclassified Croceitalea TaxID=2632280 RepID=UPI002B383C11|nr:hypothetical protein MTsPCn6_12220 [Croceitalea sp. MTPC6]GMN17001.1 hypothetical protein MTsPCn9_19370 [Croceitalea sp. MTPC9]
MFSKSNLLAILAATVVMFLLGYLLWGVLTEDFFKSHTITDVSKDPMNFPLIFVSTLIGAFILSSVYNKWARGHHSVKSGLEFGIAVGAFTGISMGLMWYATSNMMDFTGFIAEAVIEMVYYGITGIVIALIYRATQKSQ